MSHSNNYWLLGLASLWTILFWRRNTALIISLAKLLPIPGKYGNRFSLSNTSKSLSKELTLISLPKDTKKTPNVSS